MAMRRQRRGRASSEWWEERVQRRRGIPGILVGVWGVGGKDREAWGGEMVLRGGCGERGGARNETE